MGAEEKSRSRRQGCGTQYSIYISNAHLELLRVACIAASVSRCLYSTSADVLLMVRQRLARVLSVLNKLTDDKFEKLSGQARLPACSLHPSISQQSLYRSCLSLCYYIHCPPRLPPLRLVSHSQIKKACGDDSAVQQAVVELIVDKARLFTPCKCPTPRPPT